MSQANPRKLDSRLGVVSYLCQSGGILRDCCQQTSLSHHCFIVWLSSQTVVQQLTSVVSASVVSITLAGWGLGGGGGALSTWSKTLLKRIIVRQLCSSAIDFPNALSTQNIIIYVSMTNITILFDILKSISTQPDARDALLAQFSLHVHRGCLKPHSLHFNFSRYASVCIHSNIYIISHVSNMPPLAIYKPFILLPLTILLPAKHDHPRFLCVISRLNNSYLE